MREHAILYPEKVIASSVFVLLLTSSLSTSQSLLRGTPIWACNSMTSYSNNVLPSGGGGGPERKWRRTWCPILWSWRRFQSRYTRFPNRRQLPRIPTWSPWGLPIPCLGMYLWLRCNLLHIFHSAGTFTWSSGSAWDAAAESVPTRTAKDCDWCATIRDENDEI